MRYWLFTLGALFLAGASIVLLDNGLFHLVRTGSCGSSSSGYISYRPCPPGTGGHILSLIGGIFGALIGIALYAARGSKGGTAASIGLGVIMWSLLFVTIAGSVAYAAYGPGNTDNSGAKTTAIILGVIFVPMGLAPLPFALKGRRKAQQLVQLSTTDFPTSGVPTFATTPYVRPPAPPRPAATAPPAEEDPLEKIAKLGQLRDRGLLTPEEFEAQKKRLLGEI
jgi:hypothetical protein